MMSLGDLGTSVRDLGSRVPGTDRMLEAVGLARPPQHPYAPSLLAFGVGLLIGIGVGLLLQVTSELEGEPEREQHAA